MHDARSGMLLAALNHGHFGSNVHRSRDGGATRQEIAESGDRCMRCGLKRDRKDPGGS